MSPRRWIRRARLVTTGRATGMGVMKPIKLLTWMLLIAGLAAATALVAWQGTDEIASLIWRGGLPMLALALFFVPHSAFFTLSWRYLFRPGHAPAFGVAFRAMIVGTYANAVLPVAELGGEVIKARMLMKNGISGLDAAASVVLDKTVQTITVIVWGLIGFGALVWLEGTGPYLWPGLAVVAALTAGATGFVIVQLRGMFGPMAGAAAKLSGGDRWVKVAGDARALDAAVRDLYRAKRRLLAAALLNLVGRGALVFEIWVAAQLIGAPIGLLEALALRAIAVMIRSAAFLMPGGWGVQEGGFVAVGAVLGIDAEIALVLSLATRIRELVIGVPALLSWQAAEGRGLWRKRARGRADDAAAPDKR